MSVSALLRGKNLFYVYWRGRGVRSTEASFHHSHHRTVSIRLQTIVALNQHCRLIVAGQQIVRCDPRDSAVPTFHIWWREEFLTQRAEHLMRDDRRRQFA